MGSAAMDDSRPAAVRLAWFPPTSGINPYQDLLYRHLADLGVELERDAVFSFRWLWRGRGRVTLLHFHWRPDRYYDWPDDYDCWHPPRPLRRPLGWLRLCWFAAQLAAARGLGYRIVWTIHEVMPKGTSSARLSHAAAVALARSSSVLLAHDHATAERAKALGIPGKKPVHIVPHGSYLGLYPPGRPREDVRKELGIADDAVVFLSFGIVREEKDLGVLARALEGLHRADVVLVVAGEVREEIAWREIRDAAARDERIRLLPGRVPDERVAELFDACDVAVFARRNGWTSGSLILAMSLGLPVVAADAPAYVDLTGGDEAGWFFDGGDAESLRLALERAAGAAAARAEKGAAARRRAESLQWPEVARRTLELILASPAWPELAQPTATARAR